MTVMKRIARIFCCAGSDTASERSTSTEITEARTALISDSNIRDEETANDRNAETVFAYREDKVTMAGSAEEAHADHLCYAPHQPLGLKTDSKPTLVLDLDNTLVCPSTKQPSQPAHEIEILYNERYQRIWLIERPHLTDFLESLYEKYEIVVFTAGIREYGMRALQKIDRHARVSHLLDRSFCLPFGKNSKNQDIYLKNLKVLNRDLKRIILVDDREYSYLLNPENGLNISPFFGDENDNALLSLKTYLLDCAALEDLTLRGAWADSPV